MIEGMWMENLPDYDVTLNPQNRDLSKEYEWVSIVPIIFMSSRSIS